MRIANPSSLPFSKQREVGGIWNLIFYFILNLKREEVKKNSRILPKISRIQQYIFYIINYYLIR